jgi:DNA-directed RNA polymerase specialized sigma24 family protein
MAWLGRNCPGVLAKDLQSRLSLHIERRRAEDLTQEVFIRIYRTLDQYDSKQGDLANG